jgi:folate-binding protein YgfZ
MESLKLQGATRLDDWGVIRATGTDAANFLHAQLTQDIESLGTDSWRLAGYCSAKGRLVASFVVWRPSSEEVLLACSADLLRSTLKRLSMFVLRAKCSLSDASVELPVWGVAGDVARDVGQVGQCCDGARMRMSDAQGVARALFVRTPPAASSLDANAWSWLEVASGVPRVVAATAEQFVPQMVNLELVGGVNFQKGCYPGQEVVARSQYRGTLKRRAFVFSSTAAAAPGQELFASTDANQPAGMVVNAASFNGRFLVLAEVKLASLERGSLHLGSAEGPVLTALAMPYRVPHEQEL